MKKMVFRIFGLALAGLATSAYAGSGYISINNTTDSNKTIVVEAWNNKGQRDGVETVKFDTTVGPFAWYNYGYIESTYDVLKVFYIDGSGLRRQCGNDIPSGPSTIPIIGADYRTYEIRQCDANGLSWTLMPN